VAACFPAIDISTKIKGTDQKSENAQQLKKERLRLSYHPGSARYFQYRQPYSSRKNVEFLELIVISHTYNQPPYYSIFLLFIVYRLFSSTPHLIAAVYN
jgi:hypothetical protein